MRIAAISDMHGILNFTIDKSDILVICGDIMPLKIQHYNKPSRTWFNRTFIPWCNQQPVEEVFLIGGNHDGWLFRHPEQVKEDVDGTKITYLFDESTIYVDDSGIVYNIYGTPWCHQFGNWYFMGYSDEALEKIFDRMPDNIDVLLTHDPPFGYNDKSSGSTWGNADEHLGNSPLINVIEKKQPKIVFSGHIHTGDHNFTQVNNTQICNVSVVNEKYQLDFKPTYIELEKTD